MTKKAKNSSTKKDNKEKWKILEIDPLLKKYYEDDINLRMDNYEKKKKELLKGKKRISDFANGHNYYGFIKVKTGWYYREWAPNADRLYLMGDFNDWNRRSHPLKKNENGDWEIFIKGIRSLPHESFVKVVVVANGVEKDRIPLYANRVIQVQNPDGSYDFKAQIYNPRKFNWKDQGYKKKKIDIPLIYETHVGMAQEKEGIGTYKEFEENILPRVKKLGYNTIQIMAIMEHPYYGSFGYQVSNFFAPSSRFGTPKDLMSLINTAHQMGIKVIMDIIHSHAVKNTIEGINEFDGTDYQFFHSGPKGNHPAWDSKVFDYGRNGVIHFLLSNVKYWMDEFHFDGFRFDGVTSMLYHDHGLGTSFDSYDKYFSMNTDTDAVTYLQLACELCKEINPNSLLIAEDMSGMPGMCLPIKDGGIGFDYRLAMGIPDFWENTTETDDWNWDIYKMWYELTTKRPKEKTISYAESHDQALVGSKTIMFRLADQDMYWHMRKDDDNINIDRSIALHKMIRFSTISLANGGYLNFMGNEFGHPEWIDFPREGNGWSYKYCRRQWSLVDNKDLKYEYLNNFDKDMIEFIKKEDVLEKDTIQLWIEQDRKILAYKRGDLIFLFNFHPVYSFENFNLPVHENGNYEIVFSSDRKKYGGFERVKEGSVFETHELIENDYIGITIDIPNRSVLVLKKK